MHLSLCSEIPTSALRCHFLVIQIEMCKTVKFQQQQGNSKAQEKQGLSDIMKAPGSSHA